MRSLERMYENVYAVIRNDKRAIYSVWFQLYFKEWPEKPNWTFTGKKILRRCLKGTELKSGEWGQHPVLTPGLTFRKTVFYSKPEPEYLQCISTVLDSAHVLVYSTKIPHHMTFRLSTLSCEFISKNWKIINHVNSLPLKKKKKLIRISGQI